MSLLRAKLAELLPAWREEIAQLVKDHGEDVIGRVSVGQVLGGLRGAKALVCDTSMVEPETGLWIRGRPIKELAGCDSHDMFWLLMTGELPTRTEHEWLKQDFVDRIQTRDWDRGGRQKLTRAADIDDFLDSIPPDLAPTTQYGILLMLLQTESKFAAAYGNVDRADLWIHALEDALDLRARAWQAMAAINTRWTQNHGKMEQGKLPVEAGANPQIAIAKRKFSDLYTVVHSDHENGNASAFTFTVAASALSDPYLALVASLNALAGPLHGRASETCLLFVKELLRELGPDATAEQVREACWTRLRAKQVIPGFGHAVLRCPDPRFEMLKEWGDAHCADEPVYRVASQLYAAAPDVLREHGAASSPHPNVDAIAGVLLWCCGQRYPEFYTINFSLAQMNGLLANYVLARGLGLPIMRPRSVTLAELRRLTEGGTAV
jgi:citrate synthase